jgi:hypothetical protein
MSNLNVLARATEIPHPSGSTVGTPLLVPSFSSKGFGISDSGQSEIYQYFKVAEEILTESMLVSAYDIAHGFLPSIQPLTDITIVDSGGYETSDLLDLSAVFKNSTEKREWRLEQLREVYENWPEEVAAVFVSFDTQTLRQPLEQQIELAEDLLLRFPKQLKTFLIKPETDRQKHIQVDNVVANVKGMRNFDVVGLTEKELGGSLIDRMENIAKIRFAMSDAGIDTPLHIFGSLDPVSTPLYFLSGAEIFDGLTWLRYGYREGVAAYTHNTIALDAGIDKRRSYIQSIGLATNYGYLIDLQTDMKKYLLEQDFGMFRHNSKFLRESFDHLRTKIRRMK